MSSDELLTLGFCITLGLGLVSLIFQLYVNRQLKKAGFKTRLPIGKSSFWRPLIQGWQNADELQIKEVMVCWTITIVLTYVGMVGVVIAVVQ